MPYWQNKSILMIPSFLANAANSEKDATNERSGGFSRARFKIF